MAIPKIGEVLFSRQYPDYRLQIVAGAEGQIQGIVSNSLSAQEVSVQGIPRHINLLNRAEVSDAKLALLTCDIRFNFSQIQVNPKLKGGGPPLEPDLIRMGNFRMYQSNDTDLMEESFLMQAITSGVALIGNPVLGFFTGLAQRLYQGTRNRGKLTQMNARIEQLEAQLRQGGAPAKLGYDVFVRFLHNFLSDPEDQQTVIGNLFQAINAKKQEILEQPTNPLRREELKALGDWVHLVSIAIPNKRVASQVVKVGEASVAFAQAFFMVRQLGGIAAAGLSGMLGPVGLALAGISTFASLFLGDADPLQVFTMQVQGLTTQANQLQINLRFDQLEALYADLDRRIFEQFGQLHGEIAELRNFCEEQRRVVNLKLDRIRAFLSRGFTALADIRYNEYKADAVQRLLLTTERPLTFEEHRDLLIRFNSWSHVLAKNDVFTGALNANYEPEDDVALLRAEVPENVLYYLAHHPFYTPHATIDEFNLANPFIWADAAEAYMQVRLFAPQFDATYSAHHLPLFLNIYRTGQELQAFITDLQTNGGFFEGILAEYENHLADIGSGGQQDPRTQTYFDAAYNILIAYSNLAFQQSCKQDLIFASYLSRHGNRRLRLVNSQDIQELIQSANQTPPGPKRDHLRAEIFTDLHRTLQHFRGVLLQKTAEARDSHSLITFTLQRLWDFGSRHFPNAPDFAPNTYPATTAPHFTDVNRILENDIFYAVFTGNPAAIQRLIAHYSETDSLGRTPLHYASATGQLDIATRLVVAGANVNARDLGGDTPIFLARRSQKQEIESYLLSRGSHPYFDHWIPGEREYQEGYQYCQRDLKPRLGYGPPGLDVIRHTTWDKALPHIRSAAQKGHAAAQHMLGWYLFQRAKPPNYAEALSWFLQSAKQGNAEAQKWVDHCHKYHLGAQKKDS